MELYYCGNQWGYTPLGNTSNIPGGYCNPPTNLQVTIQFQYATLKWTAPHDSQGYHVEYRIGNTGPWTQILVAGTSVTIMLVPNTLYSWRVRTVCDLAESRFSSYVNGPDFTTSIAAASCTQIGVITITNMGRYYEASWTGTGALFYRVFICRYGQDCNIYYDTQETTFRLLDLAPAKYWIRVVAFCKNNTEAPTSEWYFFEYGDTKCPSPVKLIYTSSPQSIIIGWMKSSPSNPDSFNVYLDDVLVAINYPLTSFTFTGLNPNTEYKIDIRQNCKTGFSEPLTGIIRTKNTICDCEIVTLTATDITPLGFTLNFTRACSVSSITDHYELKINNGTAISIPVTENTYTVTGLLPGTNSKVDLMVICTNGESGVIKTITVLSSGCGAITNLAVDNNDGKSILTWDPVNAEKYKIELTIDGVVQPVQYVTENTFTLFDTPRGVVIIYKVTALCNIDSVLTEGASATINSTYAKGACVDYIVNFIRWLSSSEALISVDQAPGALNDGDIRLAVYTAGPVLHSQQIVNTSGEYILSGLTEGIAYTIGAYRIANANKSGNPVQDGCTASTTAYTHAPCWIPGNEDVTFTFAGPNTLQVNVINTDWKATQNKIQLQWAYEGGEYSIPQEVLISDLPYDLTVPGYGRYKLKMSVYCNGKYLESEIYRYSCPPVTGVQISVNGNKLTGLITPALQGLFTYKITLTALGQADITYGSNEAYFEIDGLKPGYTYSAKVEVICNEDPETASAPYIFTFQSGTEDNGICSIPEFEVFIQDCGLTDPSGELPGEPNDCPVSNRDWELLNSFIIPDGASSLFLEATFRISTPVNTGTEVALPGGIMGVLDNSACRPASTVVTTLEIVNGGIDLTAGIGTITTNGNITCTGAYETTGSDFLILRLRGTYLKA